MAEKKRVEVDEEHMMALMAGNITLYKAPPEEDETEPEPVKKETVQEETTEAIETEQTVKPSKKKDTQQKYFKDTYLKDAKIENRRQLYVSSEYFDTLATFLRIVTNGKVSVVGYIHNVLSNHFAENGEMLNELYKSSLNKNRNTLFVNF